MSISNLTKHAILRMAQRGIGLDDVELAEFIGTQVEGGCLVRRKDVQAFVCDLKKLANQAERLSGKRVVRAADVVITAYHATSAKERRCSGGAIMVFEPRGKPMLPPAHGPPTISAQTA